MLTRSHARMMPSRRSPNRRRSLRFLEKSNSLPRCGEHFSEKSGECGTSPNSTDNAGGHGISRGCVRKSTGLNGKIKLDKVSDVPSRTSNRVGGGGSGGCYSSGNSQRKSPRLNSNIRPDEVYVRPCGNRNREDGCRLVGSGISTSGLRKSPRFSSNAKPNEVSNFPSANSDQEEQGGSGGCGISAVGARKSPRLSGDRKTNTLAKPLVTGSKAPRLDGDNEPSTVSDVSCGDNNCRDRGNLGGCGDLDVVVRRSSRLIHCVKPLNLKDGCETTLRKVLVNKVVNDARKHCGDAMAEPKGYRRQCVLGLPLPYAVDKNKREHIEYSKKAPINSSSSHHSNEEWTPEQLEALHGAYLLAKPTPHFWKKVSKLVPGKSAKECFDMIHSEYLTPPQTRLRSRVLKTNTLVEEQGQLSASKILKSHKPLVENPIKKKKIQLAHKTIRKLMKKQSSLCRTHEADFFNILEMNSSSSPKVPGTLLSTPENLPIGRGLLKRFHEESSPGKKKHLSRFHSSTGTDLVSPPVLKQVKNMALHEKYLDHLHFRDAKRRKLEPPGGANKAKVGENVDVVGAAKNALILDATDAIKQFQLAAADDRSLCQEMDLT
ncbi:hypothetical protein MLD38_028934 [Melastoma candidum]|uniref:Uncharacterized protein n=1 Tax=Melastoma candidum TaxID=119954 RepID=A0ACB9N277_9MYRT|nr:hypothetical protein MLD38_028934 [Melastoma candidum]